MYSTWLGYRVLALGLFGLLLLGRVSSATTETICFDWTDTTVDGVINVIGNVPAGQIAGCGWAWGDGSYSLYGTCSRSHTYPSPPPYDRTVTMTMHLTNGDIGTATCDTFPWVLPVGPQPPSSGTCCGVACTPGEC
jgi:hypothetical protein